MQAIIVVSLFFIYIIPVDWHKVLAEPIKFCIGYIEYIFYTQSKKKSWPMH